jgi:hypothetical protein
MAYLASWNLTGFLIDEKELVFLNCLGKDDLPHHAMDATSTNSCAQYNVVLGGLNHASLDKLIVKLLCYFLNGHRIVLFNVAFCHPPL